MFILKRFSFLFTAIIFLFNFRIFKADITNLYRDWSGQTKKYESTVKNFKEELDKETESIVMENLPSRNFAERLACQFLVGDPEYFYVESMSYSVSGGNDYVYYVTYIASGDTLENIKQDYNNRIEQIAETIDKSLSDFKKVTLIKDYLVNNFEYDYSSLAKHNPYAMLVSGKGLCSGYCQLFKSICNKVGVDSEIVWTTFDEHAWNIVKVDNVWYHVDVTWIDGGNKETTIF